MLICLLVVLCCSLNLKWSIDATTVRISYKKCFREFLEYYEGSLILDWRVFRVVLFFGWF